ncbi:hypothetical protein BGZ83_003318, partial [Gryganskiella cystojenkinii]
KGASPGAQIFPNQVTEVIAESIAVQRPLRTAGIVDDGNSKNVAIMSTETALETGIEDDHPERISSNTMISSSYPSENFVLDPNSISGTDSISDVDRSRTQTQTWTRAWTTL